MKSKLLTLLISLWAMGMVSAQGITVSGEVLFGTDSGPASFYPVTIQWGNPAGGGSLEILTDASGHYSAVVGVNPMGSSISVIVFDFCAGITSAVSLPNMDGSFTADFHVCQDVNPPPPPDSCAAFFYYEQTGVNPYTVAFYDLSSIFDSTGIVNWFWNFGDGTAGIGPNPVHDYALAGDYIVTLTITSANCNSTFTSLVTIIDDIWECPCPPVYDPVCAVMPDGNIIEFPNACEAMLCAGIDSSQFVPCNNQPFCWANIYYTAGGMNPAGGSGLDFSFYDGSIAFDPITEWQWSFGDGSAGSGPNPEHTYAQPGFYLVTLTITTEGGCTSSATLWVLAGDPCLCPTVYDPVCVNLPDGSVYSFSNACEAQCYGYEDNELVVCDSTGGCVCPEYYSPVCVQQIDSLNGVVNYLQFDNPCFAACEGFGPADFVPCDSTVIDSCNCFLIYDPVCVISPDGSVLTFTNECFAQCSGFGPGDYTSCDPSFDNCYATFYIEQNPVNPLEVNFIDQSYSATGSDILAWAWDFGDGNLSNDQNPAHTYTQEGIYPVTLHIVTADSCESTVTQHLCIGGGGYYEGPSCQAIFYFVPDSSGSAMTYYFVDYSYGDISSWQWSFGDGTASNEQYPAHSYSQPGVYVVTLTVSGGDCSSTMSMIIVVGEDILYNSECNALFVPFLETDSLGAFFLNLSSADAVSYLWDFGDGQTSTEFFAWHQYAQPGVYEVSLTITTVNGCVNTYSATLDFGANRFIGIPSYALANSTEEQSINANSLLIFPNPTSEAATLSFESTTADLFTVSVLTADGRVLRHATINGTVGKQQHALDLAGLPVGMYLIRLQTPQQVVTQRLMKKE